MDEDELFLYPANELIAAELSVASPECEPNGLKRSIIWRRAVAVFLSFLWQAYGRIFPPRRIWKQYQLHLEVGRDLDLEKELLTLCKWDIVALKWLVPQENLVCVVELSIFIP